MLNLTRIESQRPELAPHYTKYANQTNPQDAFIALNEEGEVWADSNGEIGNDVPMVVWHGRTLRYGISPHASGDEIADFVQEHRALLERIHAGHTVAWNGSNHVGRLTEDAQAASEAFSLAAEVFEPACSVWEDVETWFQDARAEYLAELKAGRSPEELALRESGRFDDNIIRYADAETYFTLLALELAETLKAA